MFLRNILLIFLFLSVGTVGAQTTDQEPHPDSLIKVDVVAKPLNLDSIKRNITYPETLRDKWVQGKVIMKVLVDEKGNTIKHIVTESPHPFLTQEVENHLYQLRFSPAQLNNKSVKYWAKVPFNFILK